MRIYLAVARVGGWKVEDLIETGSNLLLSFYYDQETMKEVRDLKNENIPQEGGIK